ncbi:MAG: hypothetical protein QXK37_06035 [Candidatus Woesearchaeota archaeon]
MNGKINLCTLFAAIPIPSKKERHNFSLIKNRGWIIFTRYIAEGNNKNIIKKILNSSLKRINEPIIRIIWKAKKTKLSPRNLRKTIGLKLFLRIIFHITPLETVYSNNIKKTHADRSITTATAADLSSI